MGNDNMKQPTILFKEAKINDSNIQDFVGDSAAVIYGATNKDDGTITIYRYIIEHVSDEALRLNAHKLAAHVKSVETMTQAHEMRHWYLFQKHGSPEENAKNFFEMAALHVIEEISAYSAGFLYGDKEMKKSKYSDVEKVILAMHAATDIFKNAANLYLEQINLQTQSIMFKKILQNTISFDMLRKLRDTEKQNPNNLYSTDFQAIIKSYLTFDGICIYDEKSIPTRMQHLWKQTQKNIQDIKQKCNLCISTIIEHAIGINDVMYGMQQIQNSQKEQNNTRKK